MQQTHHKENDQRGDCATAARCRGGLPMKRLLWVIGIVAAAWHGKTVPSGVTVLVFFSGLAGLTAESPREDSHSMYFAKCCLPSSGLDG